MNDLGTRAELGDRISYAVIKTRTHCKDHIRVMHCHVGLVEAMHTQHAQKLPVTARIRTQTHEGIGHRVIQPARQCGQLCRTLTLNNPAPGIDHGSLGAEQHARRFANLARVTFGRRLIGAHADRLGVLVFELVLRVGQIFWDVDHNRPWTARGGDKKGLLDSRRNILRLLHQKAVFNDRAGDTDHVGLLKRILTNEMALDLTRDHDQGYRVHIGRGNARNRVGRAGPRCHQDDTGLTGGARIAVCRMGSCLLVAHQNMWDFFCLEQGIVDVERSSTGISEDVLYTFVFKGADDHLAAGQHFHGHSPSRCIRGWRAAIRARHHHLSHETLAGSVRHPARSRSRNPCIGDLRGNAASSPSG